MFTDASPALQIFVSKANVCQLVVMAFLDQKQNTASAEYAKGITTIAGKFEVGVIRFDILIFMYCRKYAMSFFILAILEEYWVIFLHD